MARGGAGKKREMLAGITYGIPLALKVGVEYLRFKRKAKRATKMFRKTLVASGIDERVAELLAADYLEASRILHHAGIIGDRNGD